MDIDLDNPKVQVRVGHEPEDTVACKSGQYHYLQAGSKGQLFIDVVLHIATRFIAFGELKWWESNIVNYNAAVTETITIDPEIRYLSVRFQENGTNLTVNPTRCS